jgi:hypothetical protein
MSSWRWRLARLEDLFELDLFGLAVDQLHRRDHVLRLNAAPEPRASLRDG